MLVDHPQVHEAVGLEVLKAKTLERQFELDPVLDEALQHAQQRLIGIESAGVEIGHEGGRTLVHGLQAMAVLLRHGLEQRGDLLFEEAGHQPFAAVGRDLVEHGQRHGQRYAVVRIAGLVEVAQGQLLPQNLESGRKALGGDAFRLVPHELVARQVKQFGLGLLRRLPPSLEAGEVIDPGRNQAVVESLDQGFVDQHVRPPRLVLQAFDLGHKTLVVRQKAHAACSAIGDFARHQPLADEQLAAQRGIGIAVAHAAPRVEHQPVKRATLPRTHRTRGLRPVRLEHLGAQQMCAHLFHPFGLDAGNATSEQARGLDLFGAHDPLARLLRQRRTGMRPELDAACAEITAGLGA